MTATLSRVGDPVVDPALAPVDPAVGPVVDEGSDCPKSVLGKAHLLLGAFGAGAFQLRLTELSRRSGVPKASAYRLAQELVQWGLLDRTGDVYQLGIRVFELGQRVPVIADLREVSRPLLVDLFGACRATVQLTVLDDAHVLVLESVTGRATATSQGDTGGRLPAACTAAGKVLLALRPEGTDVVHRHEQRGLPRTTSRSITDVEVLRAQLVDVRRRGFGVDVDELRAGHASIAVPVTGADGTVHAALSITVPSNQLQVARVLPHLQGAASGIARRVDRQLLIAG